MKRVILDTNIYGRIFEQKNYQLVISKKSKVTIYGSVIIRKELRATGAEAKIEHEEKPRKLRILLLLLYDSLVKDRNLGVTPNIGKLAEQYFSAYKKIGGKAAYHEIMEDFMIVATATIHNLEIVYSADQKTMRSDQAMKSYKLVNDLHNLPTPAFRSYEEFRQELKKPETGGRQ